MLYCITIPGGQGYAGLGTGHEVLLQQILSLPAMSALLVNDASSGCTPTCTDIARLYRCLCAATMAVDTKPMQCRMKRSIIVNLQVQLAIVAVSFAKHGQVGRPHTGSDRRATRLKQICRPSFFAAGTREVFGCRPRPLAAYGDSLTALMSLKTKHFSGFGAMYPTFMMHTMLKAWSGDAFFNPLFELAKLDSWT